MSQYGFGSPDEMIESGVYLPFVRVDIVSLEKEYLQQYYPKEIQKIDSTDPDVSFKRLIERRNGYAHWHSFERSALRVAVEQWCKENGVPYF